MKRDESRYYQSRPARLPFFPSSSSMMTISLNILFFLSLSLYLSFSPSIHLDRSLARFDANICDVSLQRTRFIAIQPYTGLSRFSIPRNPRILGSMGFRIAVIMAV